MKMTYIILFSQEDIGIGEIFSPGNSISIPLLEFFIENSKVFEFGLVSRSTVPSSFTVSVDNSELSTFEMNTIKEGIYGNKILSQVENTEYNYLPNRDSLILNILEIILLYHIWIM